LTADLTEISRIVSKIVSIPRYNVEGVARDHLIYSSTERGDYSVYAINIKSGEKKLAAPNIHMLVAAHEASSKVVFVRDVSKGFELSKVMMADIDEGYEIDVAENIEPQRIAGLAFDGERIAWSGATKASGGVYLAEISERRAERVATTKGREFVSDVNDKYIVGYGRLRGDPYSTEIFIINIKEGSFEIYTPKEGSNNTSPKLYGDKMLFISNFDDGDKMKPYILNLSTRELEEVRFKYDDIYRFDPVEFISIGWTSDGRVWSIGKKRGTSRLFLDGRDLGIGFGMVSSAAIKDNMAFIAHSSLKTPPRILAIDIIRGDVREIIGSRLPRDIEERLGNVAFVEVESFDGLKIPTFVLESRAAPKPGPTVVYPHGGPWSEVADSWSPIIVSLASLGYHVVAPNYRGSTGYGAIFRNMDIGDPGGADMEDVAAARNWAIKNGLGREGLISIVGYSYGGYTTLMQLTRKPKLWRCGVAGAPVADWEKMYELADAYFRSFQETLFGGKKELFRERSPITYVENIEAPLCIVEPQNDSRTPIQPVLDFVDKLVKLGKSFELHVIPDMGHRVSLNDEALARFLLYTALFLARCYKGEQG